MEQRPRQAYEDFVMRVKTLLFISLLPMAITLGLINGARAALGFLSFVSVCAVLLACRGLRRNKAYKFFPAYVILYAPLWVLERALSVYWALYWRVAHGGYPFGERLLAKGTGRAWVAARACMRKPRPPRDGSR
jgi:predicted anti-sigma-YlaC factor YlaD